MANSNNVQLLSSSKCFGGFVNRYSHDSSTLSCLMKFHVFIPPQATNHRVPVVFWLSGLTCTDENFIWKASALKSASELGLMLICPDTSPRGVEIEGQRDSWDFGEGAGFYITATVEKWAKHYNMFDYVTKELYDLVAASFSADITKASIFGHSMGGHGALICALKNPTKYKSVSAFAPICNPINCAWGVKAFTGYLGEDQEKWKAWDATELLKNYSGENLHILIDQGIADKFYPDQLRTESLKAVVESRQIDAQIRLHEEYDHSYYFISTFIDDHLKHHAKFLN
eukprot:TRINITY_DN381_c4_g1_i2.p1 TRINITY_DN381_c4_g1~~TRINITY_DN381_c4_g1_i2.p1  ORF type:complete len:285 (-),score=135.74 TRINITY_DN381_c4_g1_i2:483-1337(-)